MSLKKPELSHTRVVVSGDIVEVYQYEKPYVFDQFSPTIERVRSGATTRREDNLQKAQRYLRRLIFSNATKWSDQVCFITFTFKENVKDIKTANYEWTEFIRRLKKECSRAVKYTAVIEFQKRGAVHYHVLFYDLPKRIIQNDIELQIERIRYKTAEGLGILGVLWGNGTVDIKEIKKINSIRSIGAYVSKYLSKQTLDERLVGEKAYMSSRNLIKPVEYRRQKNCQKVLDTLLIDNEFVKVYDNEYATRSYGKINYSQLKIVKKDKI